jgi:serine/threonine-protein kinase
MTNQCSNELLESALSGDLPPDREEWLQHHLDKCEACSTVLHQLAGGDAWRRETAAMLVTDDLDKALRARDEWSNVDFTVEHLEPADEPNLLGRLGGYDVLEIIGRGGMGVVIKAFDPELKRLVAIKVLSPNLAQSSLARKRFTREAQAAAAVVHPNVMAIHNVQPNGPLPFLIMPLVAGESLAQRLAARGRLELRETLRIGMQAAAALAAAHEQGLVHRDVKPANILLEKGVERVVLTDFGLARAADDVSMTRWGIISGTPQYMSPEQARGETLDGRSDLFSLGCVLYEMATGVSPFRADSMMATLRRLIDDSPRAMSSLNSELPPWFISIVQRLLEKEPSRRFASAKEVNELLEGCLAHVQQPTNVPLPDLLISLRETHSLTPSQVGKTNGMLRSEISRPGADTRSLLRRKLGTKGAVAMLSILGICLFAVGVVETSPPDISGRWSGEDWGQVTLAATAAGEYTGTFSDTVSKQPGKLSLRWSRIERRFNGTWSEGEARFGQLSIRVTDGEIRGALTTDAASTVNPATPRLADLTWKRGNGGLAHDAPVALSPVTPPKPAVVLATPYYVVPDSPNAGMPPGPANVSPPGYRPGTESPNPGETAPGALVMRWQSMSGYPTQNMPSTAPEMPNRFSSTQPVPPSASVSITPIKKFSAADAVLSESLTRQEGAWTATLKAPETLRLFEVTDPKADACRVFYRAKLRTQDFKGQVYLEMWCRIPGKGEFYSRGLDNALNGSTGWVSCETPFTLDAGQRPDLIRLNVMAKGTGTVMVKDVELFISKEATPASVQYYLLQKNGIAPVNPHAIPKLPPALSGPFDAPSAATNEGEIRAAQELQLAKARLAQAKAAGAIQVDEANSLVAAAEATYRATFAGEAGRRIQSQNNMRQIALAVLNYESAYNRLPPAYLADKNGKPLLSWRVAILPFIEQDALYQKFHLDEPWDSEHNKKLINSAVAVYRSPASKNKPGMTNYLTIRGKDTVFPGKDSIKIMDIVDGTSNTIMVVEADDSKAVPWTKPDDLNYDEKSPAAGLGGLFTGGFNAVLCDGSSRFLPSTTKAEMLRRLFNRNDGEVIDWELKNSRPQKH